MQALDQNIDYRRPPQPILSGHGDGFSDNPPEWCDRCHAAGYDLGFRDGAASVRKAPFIKVDWSTTVGGIVNLIGFVALMLIAGWIGEMRGMKSEGRLNIQFSDGTVIPEKTSAAPVLRGLNGTTVVNKSRDAQ